MYVLLRTKRSVEIDGVGVSRDTPPFFFFRRYDRELVLKPAILVKKSWGGAIP